MKNKIMSLGASILTIASLGITVPTFANTFSPSFVQDEIAISGTVTLKSGATLIVRNGGVDTRVIVSQDTRMVNRHGNSISYSDIELGDRIQAFGELVGVRTLHADTIRDLVLPHGGFEQVVTGTVSQKLGGSIFIRSGVTDIQVDMNQDTLIVDRTGLRISLSALDIGDRVEAFGEEVHGVLNADTVVNLSIAISLNFPQYAAPAPIALPAPVVAPAPIMVPAPTVIPAPLPVSSACVPYPSCMGATGFNHTGFGTFDELAVAGTVTLKSGGTLIVRNGGVDTRVLVNQDTNLLTKTGQTISYSDIELGDRIQAFGILVDVRTLLADTIRNLVLPRGSFEHVVTGTVSAKTGNIVTLRSGVTDIDVVLDQDTLIVDRTGLRMSLSGLDIGDRVQAFGGITYGGFLNADTVVNLSVAITPPLPFYPPTGYPGTGYPGGAVLGGTAPSSVNLAATGTPITLKGKVTANSGNTLTVSSNGTTYTLTVDSNSKGTEKNGKGMSFAKMRVGDTVEVKGSKTDANHISASSIKDLSVAWK